MRKIAQLFVCFSESPNFTSKFGSGIHFRTFYLEEYKIRNKCIQICGLFFFLQTRLIFNVHLNFRSALRTVTFSDVKQSLDEKEEIISRSTSSRTSTTEYYSAISSGNYCTKIRFLSCSPFPTTNFQFRFTNCLTFQNNLTLLSYFIEH